QEEEEEPQEVPGPKLRPRRGLSSTHPKVLFTGVVASPGLEKTLRTLGGSLATSVFDCSHLVTDRVRRTVKFLCALARGIPIVTPQWLHKVSEGVWGVRRRPLGRRRGAGGQEKTLGRRVETFGGEEEGTEEKERSWRSGEDHGEEGGDLWGGGGGHWGEREELEGRRRPWGPGWTLGMRVEALEEKE
ncbi:MDC1 protein, partial [Galbula dea]|nr:MDC1 protein [Galbula dea]